MRWLSSLRAARRLVPAVALTVVPVVGLAPPAQAADVIAGPYPASCSTHGRDVSFTFWIVYHDDGTFSVYRFKWSTSFTPSRMVVSLRGNDGATPVVRAWGGSAGTLHDVDDTGDTGGPWEVARHRRDLYPGVYARVYLNPDYHCDSSPTIGT